MEFLRFFSLVLALAVGTGMVPFALGDPPGNKPNVLMIAIDDLNDWIGCLTT